MLNNLTYRHILLASGSPRRRELMKLLGIDFEVAPSRDVDETYPAHLPAEEVPLYLSQIKARAYVPDMRADDVYVTADTVVIVDGEVLGKPAGAGEARAMLRLLSGKVHKVVTGVTVMSPDKSVSFSVSTDVEFAALPDDEIDYYVERFRPFDKAGAYGIQEWIGAVGIRRIDGSFYNVMGLPVHRLWLTLKSF